MMNPPIQPVQQSYATAPINGITSQPQPSVEQQQKFNEEQRMAISFDIAAEYSAISRMQSIIADMSNQLQKEEDPDRRTLIENRINTLNNMILQREAKINQMEQTKAQYNTQIK